jgi:hypothetical protein
MVNRMARWALMPLAALTFAACDDAEPSADPPIILLPGEDAAIDDAALPDMGEVDATPADQGPPPPVLLDEPRGRVYAADPITDDGMLTEVVLTKPTDPQGKLTSEWVQVFNCLNEPGGLTARPDLGGLSIEVSLCHEVQTVVPDPDGHYLSIEPPEDGTDGNDPFAEVMMYHHVNVVHDYFKDQLGFTDLDFPLPALVNVMLKTDPPLPIPGFTPGPDGWIGFPNAAFFPKESWDALAGQFGLEGRDSDAIIFGQADHDFSYDARVIYHEYTHAVIGTGRLQATAVADRFGLDASPRAMNEGFADYFAATLSEGADIGVWGIGQLSPAQVRNLTEPRRCPDDLIDQVHTDGRIVGSALWALRGELGAELTDAIVWRALEQFGEATTHAEAGELIALEAEAESAEAGAKAREVLTDFGLIDCERALEWTQFLARISRDGLPHRVEGTSSVGLIGFNAGAPAYKQFYIDVPEGTAGVTLTWSGQGQGGLAGGGGAPDAAMRLYLRENEPVEVQVEGVAQYTVDNAFTPPLEGNEQVITLDASCLPDGGRLYTLFINPGQGPFQITNMDIEMHADGWDEPPPGLVECDAD